MERNAHYYLIRVSTADALDDRTLKKCTFKNGVKFNIGTNIGHHV